MEKQISQKRKLQQKKVIDLQMNSNFSTQGGAHSQGTRDDLYKSIESQEMAQVLKYTTNQPEAKTISNKDYTSTNSKIASAVNLKQRQSLKPKHGNGSKMFGTIEDRICKEVVLGRQEMRVSTLGLNSDEENDSNTCEDIYNDKYEQHFDEIDKQIPGGIANSVHMNKPVHQKRLSQASKLHPPPIMSRSPRPHTVYDNFSSPGSSTDFRSSHQAFQFLTSQYENQNVRNADHPQGHKSNPVQLESNPIKQKKKSFASVNGSMSSQIQPGFKKPSQTKDHKKTQSLYNKKIVEIISGLQQSLGVIASNVKNSFSNEEQTNALQKQPYMSQQKALIESAMLAQKLAKMTSNLCTVQTDQSKRVSAKRKHSKNAFKTIEEQVSCTEVASKFNTSNRVSIDFQKSSHTRVGSSNPKGTTNHHRTKSDVQQARKQKYMQVNLISNCSQQTKPTAKQSTVLTCSNDSIDQAQVKVVKAKKNIASSNSQLGKFLDDQYLFLNSHQPNSTKNANTHKASGHQTAQNSSQRRAKMQSHSKEGPKQKGSSNMGSCTHSIQSSVLIQNPKSTIEHPRSSISLVKDIPEVPFKGERMSDANFIAKMSQKYNNLFIQSTASGSIVENRLKSAASSPTLHSQQEHMMKMQANQAKRKDGSKTFKTNVFEFPVQMSKQPEETNHQKKIAAKKVAASVSLTAGGDSSTHKRSISDGQKLTNMFHFKQQMLLNKILTTQNPNLTGQKNTEVHHTRVNSTNITKGFVSGLTSKRMSKEDQENILPLDNYSSPRSQLTNFGNGKQQMAHLKKSSECEIFNEMKMFLSKFAEQAGSQSSQTKQSQQYPNANSRQQNQIQPISESTNSQLRYSQKIPQKSQKAMKNQSKKQRTIEASPQHKQTEKQHQVDPSIKRMSIQAKVSGKGMTSNHKRAKSDAIQMYHSEVKNVKGFKKVPESIQQEKLVGGQKMFFLNAQPLIHSDSLVKSEMYNIPQQIYSARASPSKSNYYTLEDTHHQYTTNQARIAKSGSNQYLLNTNRSESIKNSMSNQTTLKKHQLAQQHSEKDTPQFNYIQPLAVSSTHLPKARALYTEFQKQESHSSKGSKDIQVPSKIVLYSDGGESYEESANCFSIVSQSPRLKILPTPQAIQPCKSSYDNILTSATNEIPSNFQIAPQSINTLKDENFNCDLDYQNTMDSNFTTTNEDQLSPRSKEKRRLIKLIKVSFQKLKEPIKTSAEFYKIGKMLGKGAFGRVNLAIHKLCDHLVAVKSINKQFLSEDEGSKKKVMQEVLILQKTRNPHIVKLFDSFETNKHIVFVMELCSGGDLLNYVRKRRKLKEEVAQYVFRQVVAGLYYCHAKGIVHRDIKLDNLLFDENGRVKICDFGVSRLLINPNEVMTEQCGTPAYIAPEILKDKGYKGFGVDIWSLGVCLYAMLYGTVPFKANNMSELHQLILKAKYSLKDEKAEISEEAKSLIKALLEPEPSKRLNIEQVRDHPWLQEDECAPEIEIFTELEKQTIQKDFSYQDMTRYKRNEQSDNANQVCETEHFFTEHALDSTTNGLLKNCSTKSIVLAPFNSTRSKIAREDLPDAQMNQSQENTWLPPLEIDEDMIFDKKVIKFAPRVKDINRQYEMNNNCELDNGVTPIKIIIPQTQPGGLYNKFVKQSTNKGSLSQENSLVTSMNNEDEKRHLNAPLVSQNSDEEAEAELIQLNKRNNNSELQQMQSFIQQQFNMPQIKEEKIIVNGHVVEMVEKFGYPRKFIVDSVENLGMNDASTNYFLYEHYFSGFIQFLNPIKCWNIVVLEHYLNR